MKDEIIYLCPDCDSSVEPTFSQQPLLGWGTTYVVDRWPPCVRIAQELIAQARTDSHVGRLMTIGEGVVDFHVANGEASYEIDNTEGPWWHGMLLPGSTWRAP